MSEHPQPTASMFVRARARVLQQELVLLLIAIVAVLLLATQTGRFLTVENVLNQGRLLTEVGLNNAAAALGFENGGLASLEAIVQARPEFLVVSDASDRAEDDGRAFLLHPALERFYPLEKRIVLPERLTVCGGVMLAEALDVLVRELQRVSP